MMRRVWAAVLTALAVVGVFLVLAVSQRQAAPSQPQVVLTRTASGALVPMTTAPSGSVHGTTQTSPAAAGTTQAASYVQTSSGQLVPVASSTAPQATTRTS
jgi:hypothetical protein